MKRALFFAVLVIALAIPSFAGGILYTGSTSGVFTTSPGSGVSLGSTYQGLSFSGSTFSCITDAINNRCDLGNIPGTPNVDNLGSLQLSIPPDLANYNGLGFTLTVTFTAPAGTSPNPSTFTGSLSGFVSVNTGGVGITWVGNGPQPDGTVPLPPFHTPSSAGGAGFIQYTASTGPFVLHVNPTNNAPPNSNPGSTIVPITGHIHDRSAIPEPTTMSLMGLGFVVAGLLGRKFRK
ncbi:MAG TPA: PEP-CTERM sorting domain-containing protein [Bryobacteraceae bacterium]|nr:PEP-CTERM sorting domain-containing protein [Bryobacteraceae bacterium]